MERRARHTLSLILSGMIAYGFAGTLHAQLPDPGMDIDPERTALVVTFWAFHLLGIGKVFPLDVDRAVTIQQDETPFVHESQP